jgi:hypothetical protein
LRFEIESPVEKRAFSSMAISSLLGAWTVDSSIRSITQETCLLKNHEAFDFSFFLDMDES